MSNYKHTCVSKATATLVIVDQLHTVEAAGSITGRREALVEIPLTVFSNESWGAGACVAAHTVHALSSIQTARFPGALLGCAVIIVHFTLDSYRAENRWISLNVSSKVVHCFQDSILSALNIIF